MLTILLATVEHSSWKMLTREDRLSRMLVHVSCFCTSHSDQPCPFDGISMMCKAVINLILVFYIAVRFKASVVLSDTVDSVYQPNTYHKDSCLLKWWKYTHTCVKVTLVLQEAYTNIWRWGKHWCHHKNWQCKAHNPC